jgi:hypothetical protein
MEKCSKIYSLEEIAVKMGVIPSRVPYITKIYKENRHNTTLLFQLVHDETLLSEVEATAILMFIGAVLAGQAVDDMLHRPDIRD